MNTTIDKIWQYTHYKILQEIVVHDPEGWYPFINYPALCDEISRLNGELRNDPK